MMGGVSRWSGDVFAVGGEAAVCSTREEEVVKMDAFQNVQ